MKHHQNHRYSAWLTDFIFKIKNVFLLGCVFYSFPFSWRLDFFSTYLGERNCIRFLHMIAVRMHFDVRYKSTLEKYQRSHVSVTGLFDTAYLLIFCILYNITPFRIYMSNGKFIKNCQFSIKGRLSDYHNSFMLIKILYAA